MPRQNQQADRLSPREEAYLKAAKEISVKFIETGRLSVAAFSDNFREIYRAIKTTLEGGGPPKS